MLLLKNMPISKKLIVYYFSGTGNSENVARWLADVPKTKAWKFF